MSSLARIGLRSLPVRQAFRSNIRRYVTEAELAGPNPSTFVKEREAVKHHAAKSSALWMKLSLTIVPVSLVAAGWNAYVLWNEHWEHEAHLPPREERPYYDYLNIRSKNFPWGDGNKTLFWNDNVNYYKQDD